jgi:hypothetical protein
MTFPKLPEDHAAWNKELHEFGIPLNISKSLLKLQISFVIHRLDMEEGRGTINGAQQQFVSHGIHSEEYSCTRAVSIMSREMVQVHWHVQSRAARTCGAYVCIKPLSFGLPDIPFSYLHPVDLALWTPKEGSIEGSVNSVLFVHEGKEKQYGHTALSIWHPCSHYHSISLVTKESDLISSFIYVVTCIS